MPTQNPRLNITLDPETHKYFGLMAKKLNKSMSEIAEKLIEDAITDYEDIQLAKIADERLDRIEKGLDKPIPHDEFWAQAMRPQ